MIIARQSTARTVMVGPVLDADGVAVTDAVVGDFKISKNGGAPAALNGSATLTHRHTGMYSLALTASDLDTVGQAEVTLDDSTNAAPVKEITVIEEAVYDISFASSATGAVPVASIANNAITASAIASDAITAAKIATGAIDADAIASDAITAAKIASSAITSAKFAAGAIDASAIADNAIDAGAIASNALALAKVATDLRQAFGLNLSGTLSGTHSDTTADLGASAPTEDVSGQTLFFPAHQLSRVISSYNTGTGVATFDSIGVTLANADVWHLFATAPSTGGSGGGDATEAKQDTIIALIGTPAVDLATDIGTRASQTSVNTIDDLLDTEIGALTTELAKVPKSDGTATWNATALAAIQSEANDALVAYDPPTKAELDARTLAAASYATASAQATAQADLDTLTGTDGVILATSQPNYAPATAAALTTVDGIVDTIVATTNKLDDTLEDQGGGTYGFTEAALAEAPSGTGASAQSIVEAMFQNDSGETAASAVAGSPVYEIVQNAGGGSSDWDADERTAIRAILGIPGSGTTPADPSTGILDTIRDAVATRASQSSVDDLPTNSELATALGSADDAVLAAIAGLNNLSSAQAQTAAAAALAAYDPPTRAEATADKEEVIAAVEAVEADTQDIQGRIPASLDSGYLEVSVKRVGTTTLAASGTGGQGYGAAP